MLGCAAPPRGSPEGRSPFGRRYGGCASINHLLFFILPLPLRKGARGMVHLPTQESEGVPQAAGYPQGAPLRCWVCRGPQEGVQRDAVPLAGGMEGCASINHLLYSRGSPEGHSPFGRHRCPAAAPIASLRLAMTGSGWRPAPGYASSSSTYISGLPATHASMLIRLRWGSRCAISVMSARRCSGSVM